MTKKIVFWVSFVIVLLFLASLFSVEIKLCPAYGYSSCSELANAFGENVFIFIPLFILSIITYKMRDEIFRTWMRFTYVWIPLTLILVFIAPEYQNSWLPIYEKGFVSFVMSSLFLLISLIIIIAKRLSLKNS